MSDEDEILILDGQEMTLSQLAGLSYDETEEVSGFVTPPVGLYQLRIKEMGVTTYDKELDDDEGTEKRGIVFINHDIVAVRSVVKNDKMAEAQNLVDEEFRTNFFIETDKPMKAWGRAKKLLSAVGFKGSGGWAEIYQQVVGYEYIAAIQHQRNKQDPDNPYTKIDPSKSSPLQSQETEAA